MKFYGAIGYGVQTETAPGVWEETIIEYNYYGDVTQNSAKFSDGEPVRVNQDILVGNSISIVADAYLGQNFHAIRYISWAGTLWVVTKVDVQSPRLVLRLGGVYHGPVGSPSTP